jgi:hypothetical protein
MINHYSISKLCLILISASLFSCADSNNKKVVEQKTTADNAVNSQNSFTRDFTYSFKDEAQKFSFPNRKAKEIFLTSGTLINVPKYCFVDKSGIVVNGDVDLFFEEFLSAGSIISSQINMKYDSAGTKTDFESAGMFRINAFQKGEALFIAKGKSIDVFLATTDTDKNFNAYYSTDDGNDWSYIDRSTTTPNNRKKENLLMAMEQLKDAVKPLQPTSYSANGKYFDLNLSHSYTYDLKSLLGIVWEYAGSDKKKDPAVSKTNFNRDWDFVNIVPSAGDKRGVYDILLQNKDTTIKTIARPVYRGAVLDAENEQFAAEIGEFNMRMNQIKNEQKQALAESSFLRVIAVKNLGLYNYDRQYHEEDMTPVLANFNFGADSLKDYPISVYLITGNGMAVIKYPPHDWEKFMYARKDLNKLIAILPNQEICTFSAQRFKKEGPAFPENSPGKYTFKLIHTGVKANNSKDIDHVLSTI